MKGIVFTEFLDLVEEKFGLEMVDAIISQSKLESKGVYTSIGVFASSLTENQVIAFIVGIAIVLVFFLMDKLLYFVPASMAGIIQYMSTEFHLSNISRGVIDTRNLIYFGSIIGFFLFMTTRVLESRKWS